MKIFLVKNYRDTINYKLGNVINVAMIDPNSSLIFPFWQRVEDEGIRNFPYHLQTFYKGLSIGCTFTFIKQTHDVHLHTKQTKVAV